MSTEIKQIGRLHLTQFFGGALRGICIQVTEDTNGHYHYIQITEAEALELAAALIAWVVERKEKP
jgi:hypothetical protein